MEIPEQENKKRKLTEEPDYTKNYNRDYYTTNKLLLLNKMSEQINCDHCNQLVTKSHLNRHKKQKNVYLIILLMLI